MSRETPRPTTVRRGPARPAPEAAAEPGPEPAVAAAPPAVAPAPSRASTQTDWAALEAVASMDRAEVDSLMAEYAPKKGGGALRAGQKVSARVSRVTATTVFFDVGGKADAAMDRAEFGEPVQPGDRFDLYVRSTRDGELRLTRSLSGDATRELLAEARAQGIPVQGRVTGRNEGGYEVQLSGGVRAFCPTGQIHTVVGDDLDAWVGRSLTFRVIELRGRDAIVSHRAIVEAEARAAHGRLLAEMKVGTVADGVVSRLADFGAFVRLENGLEGLVRLPNLARVRPNHPGAVVKEGQAVKVRVLEVDTARGRLDLGIRQAEDGISPREARVDPEARQQGSFGTLGGLLQGVKVRG